MTKLDLIELIIKCDDDIFEELKYADWDVEFVEKLLLLCDKISYVGDTDKIGYIEIDNKCLYVEPKTRYEFTSFESDERNSGLDETGCLNYRWNIKKVD